jgi:hypothetical protein
MGQGTTDLDFSNLRLPKVLGAATQQTGGLASSGFIGPVRPVNYQPAPVSQVNNTRSLNQAASSPFDFTSNITNPSTPLGGGGSQMDVINKQFDDFNNYLNEQGSMAQSNFNDMNTLLTQQKTDTTNQYNQERQTQTEGIKKNESLNLSKVRQLLSDLQQSNAARTAVTGGGSSAGEALSERFGRKAQEGLSNVTSQADEALTRVSTFYDNKITELNDNYSTQIMQAKQVLDENLANINYQRNASATSKQQSTLSAWQEYYNNVNQAKIQAANFQAQLDTWKQQQDSSWSAVNPFNSENANTYNAGVSPSLDQGNYQGSALGNAGYPTTNPFYQFKRSAKQDEEQNPLYPYGQNFNTNVGIQK